MEANFGDFAQEALIKITANLDSFRGESRFTTWAQKIAVNVALTELKRKRWRDVSLQELLDRRGASDRGPADTQLTAGATGTSESGAGGVTTGGRRRTHRKATGGGRGCVA